MARSFGCNPTITFDVEAVKIGLRLEGEAPEGSLSGLYFTVHLPQRANPSKVALAVERGEVPSAFTLLYDGPDRSAHVEVLATAGASAYPVEVTGTVGEAFAGTVIGQTGTTMVLPVTW